MKNKVLINNTHDSEKGDISVLISGGVDSCILLTECLQTYASVLPIYVKTGLFWENSELFWLKKFLHSIQKQNLRKLSILSIPVEDIYGTHWSITGENVPGFNDPDETCYLPGRNILLLSVGAVHSISSGIKTIALGTLAGNPFPDADDSFIQQMESVIHAGMASDFSVLTPYCKLSKFEVLQKGKNLPLNLTFSCMHPVNHHHCRDCSKCAERIRAFNNAGIIDETLYLKKKE